MRDYYYITLMIEGTTLYYHGKDILRKPLFFTTQYNIDTKKYFRIYKHRGAAERMARILQRKYPYGVGKVKVNILRNLNAEREREFELNL